MGSLNQRRPPPFTPPPENPPPPPTTANAPPHAAVAAAAGMNRISREALAAARAAPAGPSRDRSGSAAAADRGEKLDLFARARHGVSPASHPGSDVMLKLGRISVGSVRQMPFRSTMDDLLSSPDGVKHDYDWLLTPPETPLFSPTNTSNVQLPSAAPRSNSSLRSVSASKTSRLSVTSQENGHSTKPTRSSSATRPSISNIYSTYSSNSNRTSILNTSTASVTSSRPVTPTSRSSSTRNSAPAARPAPTRSSTPTKSRPSLTSSTDKARPSQICRPSTPTSRPQLSTSLNSTVDRPASRPSTPARRNSLPTSTSALPRSSSVGRAPPGRVTATSSRASSPSPRARAPPQPIVPPDFPLDAPPNLRTTLPDRPVSAGRSRPGAALTIRVSSEPVAAVNPSRRQSSPVVTRGRLPELSRKSQLQSNGHEVGVAEVQKPVASRPVKPTATSESTGFGRTISKKSFDMALKHMDIRQSAGSIRSVTSNSLYPQSIRPGTTRGRPGQFSDSPSSVGSNGSEYSNGCMTKSPVSNRERRGENGWVKAKMTLEQNVYESYRYDSILLKEDLKNTNWLHSVEDKSDQSPVFDQRFESLPEPFGLV